ncbi:hydrogenase maturation nickel metallochaperone HypA [Acidiferrobacter sp.]|uniref:hydrogenase maturation nickel metallochaperone HypA n=1 Tax=Acidiferrobacter sp. TaxID=1872107 RepID=UPI0026114900|nr:hydrogenase maturation nickel metallochaperone HypA [Acidiferrobacter sp.]
MHEMALCESLMAIIEQEATMGRFHQVHSVSLEVGLLAGVEPEALQFGFQAVTHGTVAEGAELRILPATAQALCVLCGLEETISRPMSLCPACHGPLHVSGGRGLRIKEMEVE